MSYFCVRVSYIQARISGKRTKENFSYFTEYQQISVRKNAVSFILIYIQQDATLHSLFYLETALHISGGTITYHQERKQLSAASGNRYTVLLSAAIVEELELV
jgi:hypothetical protein